MISLKRHRLESFESETSAASVSILEARRLGGDPAKLEEALHVDVAPSVQLKTGASEETPEAGTTDSDRVSG